MRPDQAQNVVCDVAKRVDTKNGGKSSALAQSITGSGWATVWSSSVLAAAEIWKAGKRERKREGGWKAKKKKLEDRDNCDNVKSKGLVNYTKKTYFGGSDRMTAGCMEWKERKEGQSEKTHTYVYATDNVQSARVGHTWAYSGTILRIS